MKKFKFSLLTKRLFLAAIIIALIPILALILGQFTDGCMADNISPDQHCGVIADTLFFITWSFLFLWPISGLIVAIAIVITIVQAFTQPTTSDQSSVPPAGTTARTIVISILTIASILIFGFYFLYGR